MFFKWFFFTAEFRDRSVKTWNPETTGSQMTERKFVPLSTKLLFQNPGLNCSFIFRCTVVDQRQAPSTPTEVYLCMAFSSHRRYPSSPGKWWLFPYYSMDGHNEFMTFGSILMDVPDTWEAIPFPFSQTSSRSSSHTPHSVFTSLQPGLAWSSVGNHLTNQPPTGDVFDS